MKNLVLIFASALIAAVLASCVYANDISVEINNKNLEISTSADDPRNFEQYATKYADGTYHSGYSIPLGEYMILALPNKSGKIRIYDTIDSKITEEEIRDTSHYFEYSYYLNIEKELYVEVENAVIIPKDDVKPLDISKPGYFRVGVDIPAGVYTFRINQNQDIGYADVVTSNLILGSGFYLSKSRNSKFVSSDNPDDIVLSLNRGDILYKSGVDIYDSQLKLKTTFSPIYIYNDNYDKEYNFSDVRDSYKKMIYSELTDIIKIYSSDSKSSDRFKESYKKNVVAKWQNEAQNDAERLYLQMAEDIYDDFLRFIHNSETEYAALYTKSIFTKYIRDYRNSYLSNMSAFNLAQSFSECDKIKNQIVNFEYIIN